LLVETDSGTVRRIVAGDVTVERDNHAPGH
jgi:hypothetical protein